MLSLRIAAASWACLAVVAAAGCGNAELTVGVNASAINSCNDVSECPLHNAVVGMCVTMVCNGSHECDATTDATKCPVGCVTDPDCLITGACFVPSCNSGTCDFAVPPGNMTCECVTAADCTNAASSCQHAAACVLGVCTYTAKTTDGCCNDASDCNAPATCNSGTNNKCGCGVGKTYCPNGPSGCVSSNECCQDSDCGAGNTCSDGTCTCNGGEQHCAGVGCIAAGGCCDDGDCIGATCNTSHVCTCSAAGDRYCNGVGCLTATQCCTAADCTAHADATVACTASACVYTCDGGFHDCSGTCEDDTSVASCGASCTACPTGTACQTPACSGGACGFVASGGSPCCNVSGDCTPGNSCQQATACMTNQCVFGSTGAGGCCNVAADCPTPTDACLEAACVANQCATAPVAGCSVDLSVDDMSEAELDLALPPPPDQAKPLSLSGGGGCTLDGAASPSSLPALALVALFLVALGLRRRRA